MHSTTPLPTPQPKPTPPPPARPLPAPAPQVTLQTLAGVLARHSPRIYTVTAAPGSVDDLKTDASLFWLEQIQSDASSYNNLEFDDTYLHDFKGLLAHVVAAEAGVVDGFVKYDPATNSTNAALIACAASDSNLLAVGSDATAEYLSTELNVPEVSGVGSILLRLPVVSYCFPLLPSACQCFPLLCPCLLLVSRRSIHTYCSSTFHRHLLSPNLYNPPKFTPQPPSTIPSSSM